MFKSSLGCILLVAVTALSVYGQVPLNETGIESLNLNPADDPDFEKLQGKWIVTSVTYDGELTPAQIGQKKGDIISIVPRDDHAYLS